MPEKYPRFYILVGDQMNWKIALTKNIWGFTAKNHGSWNTSNVGDFVAFYVTIPTQKIVGLGQITRKFEGEDFVWPDEKFFKRILWKHRIQFSIFHLIKNWDKGIHPPPNFMLNSGRRVIPKEGYLSLVNDADKKWKTNLMEQILIKINEQENLQN